MLTRDKIDDNETIDSNQFIDIIKNGYNVDIPKKLDTNKDIRKSRLKSSSSKNKD